MEHALPDGTRLAYEHLTNGSGRQTVLLVHGAAAHGGWWAEVAPLLVGVYDLLIPDLPGHGASDHTDDYSGERWAAELADLITATVGGPVLLVGHSMGARVSVYLAALHPDLIERLVLIDIAVRPRPGTVRGRERRPYEVYSSAEDALHRYRLRPSTPGVPAARLRRLAERALIRTERGWTWRSDYRASQRFIDEEVLAKLHVVRCPAGLIYGEVSPFVNADELAAFESAVASPLSPIGVPGSAHHVPVEQPEACATAILTMLEAAPLR